MARNTFSAMRTSVAVAGGTRAASERWNRVGAGSSDGSALALAASGTSSMRTKADGTACSGSRVRSSARRSAGSSSRSARSAFASARSLRQASLRFRSSASFSAAAAAATDQGYETPTEGLQGRYYYNFELYAEWGDFSYGPHAQLGFIFGDNPFQNAAGGDIDLAAGEDFAKTSTWQGIVSWKFPIGTGDMALEPLLRFGWADTNTDVSDNEVWGFTPGVQIFFYGRNKLALNWDIASPTTDALRSEKTDVALRIKLLNTTPDQGTGQKNKYT